VNPTADAATFHRIVEERRSVRAFLPDPVPRDVLERCLESARRAPSSSNLQPWEFVVVADPTLRASLDAACLGQRAVTGAPLLVAVVAHGRAWRRTAPFILETLRARGRLRASQERYWGRLVPLVSMGGPFGLLGALKSGVSRIVSLFRPMPNLGSAADHRVVVHKSTALAAANFMLALRAEGYDSCPIEGFDPWRARRALRLAPGAEVCMFVAAGRRAEGGVWWDRILMPREWVVTVR
jgi:nitroreductase